MLNPRSRGPAGLGYVAATNVLNIQGSAVLSDAELSQWQTNTRIP